MNLKRQCLISIIFVTFHPILEFDVKKIKIKISVLYGISFVVTQLNIVTYPTGNHWFSPYRLTNDKF